MRFVRWIGLLTVAQPFISSQNEDLPSDFTRRLTRSMRMKVPTLSASFSAKLWRFLTDSSTVYSICSYASSILLCILKRLQISFPVDQKITSVRLSTKARRRWIRW